MNRLLSASLAGIFGTASTFAVLASGVGMPANHAALLSSQASIARADDDNNQGDEGHGGKNCVNPAGHTRGWCKHNGSEDNNGRHRYRRGTTLNGTVLAVNGNMVQFRLDNGQVITVNDQSLLNAGQTLNVGQHYTLRGSVSNGVFYASANGYNNNGYGNGGNYAQSISGTIVSVNGNTLQLARGGLNLVTVDFTQAAQSGRINGSLTPLRAIRVYGYPNGNGVFIATSIQ